MIFFQQTIHNNKEKDPIKLLFNIENNKRSTTTSSRQQAAPARS